MSEKILYEKKIKNNFIVFEGIDGSGKTLISDMLANILREKYPVHLTAEPTSLPTGKFIREILKGNVSVTDKTLAAMFHADRLEHIYNPTEGLLHLLESHTVISDRYELSNIAYSGIDIYNARKILRPDLTIFMDISPENAMERIAETRADTEIFETQARLTETAERYKTLIEKYKDTDNIKIVDATNSPQKCVEEILGYII
jgi:dTMP kinase